MDEQIFNILLLISELFINLTENEQILHYSEWKTNALVNFWGVHYCLVGHMFALHVQVHLLY